MPEPPRSIDSPRALRTSGELRHLRTAIMPIAGRDPRIICIRVLRTRCDASRAHRDYNRLHFADASARSTDHAPALDHTKPRVKPFRANRHVLRQRLHAINRSNARAAQAHPRQSACASSTPVRNQQIMPVWHKPIRTNQHAHHQRLCAITDHAPARHNPIRANRHTLRHASARSTGSNLPPPHSPTTISTGMRITDASTPD
jgi:hypothetical protein